MSINYDFSDLEAFLAVMDTGSFHRAAEALSLSQPAVTRRVQKLEGALASVLFERTTRNVRPTLAAKRLQARAAALLDDARETTRAMRDDSVAFAHQRSLVVTVAIVSTLVAALIPDAVRRFRQSGQGARIRLLDAAANDVSEAVAGGEADFGVVTMPMLEPNTDFEMLFEDRMGLVLPTGHALAGTDSLNWNDLDGSQLVLPARGTGNRALIDEAMARAGIALTWTFESERSATALALCAGGAGVAVLPRSAMGAFADDRVVWRDLRGPAVTRTVGLLSRTGLPIAPAAGAFRAAIRASCSAQSHL